MIITGVNQHKFVKGRVVDIDKQDKYTEYSITALNDDRKRQMVIIKSEKPTKVKLDDMIIARVVENSDNELWFKYAYIKVPEDLAYLNAYLKRYFKNESYAGYVYNTFTKSIDSLNQLERKQKKTLTTWYNYLSNAAYSKVNSFDLFMEKYKDFAEFTGLIHSEKNYGHIIDKDDRETARKSHAYKFLRSWYYHVYTRVVRMFGITGDMFDEDIINDKMVLDFLFKNKNPYLIPFIPNSICQEIELTLDIVNIPDKDKEKNKVMNMIAEKVMRFGSNYCPKKYVLKKFPWLTDQDEVDMEFRFNLFVDRRDLDNVKYYIRGIKRIQDEFVRFVTTIKQEPEDRRRITPAIGASFSPEQRNAIVYSLLNNVSCITGRAGTGKCLSPDTEILMYDRSKKKAKDIQINDLLMGPDFTSRRVLSLASDVDIMYRVSYSDGYFECNQVHILTLFQISSLKVVDIELNQISNIDDYLLIQVNDGLKDIRLKKFRLTCLGLGQYNGFDLGDSDRRFLLADYVVTHNTRCIAELAKNIINNERSCYMVSFTGKAVARMREVLKKHLTEEEYEQISANIHTFHSLAYSPIIYTRIDYLIIDEASMASTPLFVKLLNRLESRGMIPKKLIFTGDNNQLDPISWGSMFYQVIKSQTIPVIELTQNFRMNGGKMNGILVAANKILDEKNYKFNDEGNEFVLMDGANSITETDDITEMYILSQKYGESCIAISCYNNTVTKYNKMIQEKYQAAMREITGKESTFIIEKFKEHNNRKWYVGDRVVQKYNNKTKGVMNGMTGVIKAMSDRSVFVTFDMVEEEIEYFIEDFIKVNPRECLSNDDKDSSRKNYVSEEDTTRALDLAYVVTVNKAQGSEWDNCSIILSDITGFNFANKEKIYTMITRSKRLCFVYYRNLSAINQAANTRQRYRYDDTWEYLQEELPIIQDERYVKKEKENFLDDFESEGNDAMPDDFDPLDFM